MLLALGSNPRAKYQAKAHKPLGYSGVFDTELILHSFNCTVPAQSISTKSPSPPFHLPTLRLFLIQSGDARRRRSWRVGGEPVTRRRPKRVLRSVTTTASSPPDLRSPQRRDPAMSTAGLLRRAVMAGRRGAVTAALRPATTTFGPARIGFGSNP